MLPKALLHEVMVMRFLSAHLTASHVWHGTESSLA